MIADLSAQTGIIFNIQRYSLHDGGGIRTIVFMKGCPLRCVWCANPESQAVTPEIMVRSVNCIGCGMCLKACPKGALSPTPESIFHNARLCNVCGACATVCNSDGISLVGREVTAGEVYRQIDRDHIFYRLSGGGVTFSGGEPLMQPDFLVAMLRLCKLNSLNTVIETCGAAPWETVERTLEDTDEYYYDVKVVDTEAHMRYTGEDNRRILKNLQLLIHTGKKVLVRIPLVPGYNDGKHLDDLGNYLRGIGISKVQLLPYHSYGAGKYPAIGKEYRLEEVCAPTHAMITAAVRILEAYGIVAIISGN